MAIMSLMRKPAASPASAAPHPDLIAELRDRRGERASSFTPTDAQKRFGRVLGIALPGGAVVITKHDAPKAIFISVDEVNPLTKGTHRTLDPLRPGFEPKPAR